jgi:hypothetical protein
MRIDVVHTWPATLDVRPQSLKLVVMDADGNELLKAGGNSRMCRSFRPVRPPPCCRRRWWKIM